MCVCTNMLVNAGGYVLCKVTEDNLLSYCSSGTTHLFLLFCFVETKSLRGLELIKEAKLAVLSSPEILLLPRKLWVYKYMPLQSTVFLFFNVVSEDRAQVLTLARQALCHLSYFPSPFNTEN